MKGWKTLLKELLAILSGVLVGAGAITPELGAEATVNVIAAVEAFEVMVGTGIVIWGTIGVFLRHVTDTVAGWRK